MEGGIKIKNGVTNTYPSDMYDASNNILSLFINRIPTIIYIPS